ncbi:nuclear transport factor 2 family protein [Sinorhizobium arboris]|uniref:nuclear transport factor 2 family protein n=1 Tax=Sinorhizobium arboris TaxID=76745 RepID=UPI000426730A|nr:nuclear transport factor 2 family protein [Sinorhizobium arboris]
MSVSEPAQMNEAFARAFNSRNIENLVELYEPEAILRVNDDDRNLVGIEAIRDALHQLL